MYKPTDRTVKEIIDKYIGFYGDNIPPIDYLIVDKKYHLDNIEAPASLIGPIDGAYGLYVNLRDYIFDSEEILLPIILHELVHYKLLLDGIQSKENQHDETFQNLAHKIEELTNVSGIAYGKNHVHENIRYRNQTFYPIFIVTEHGKLITRVEKNKINYWKKYLSEGIKIGQFKDFRIINPTNKAIFEEIPLTTDIGLLNCIHYDEEMLHLGV